MHPVLESLKGGLIVSCQAAPGSPMDSPAILGAFAKCAVNEGAVGIRANHGVNIEAIVRAVSVPVIGLKKRDVSGFEVYITPEIQDVREVAAAGAKIVALDATNRPRPGAHSFSELARVIHEELGLLVMADISTLAEGIAAAESGADIVGTTMSGYTPYTAQMKHGGPDLHLVESLVNQLGDSVPVFCEGRVSSPQQAAEALDRGAFAVVVGSAITAPGWITSQFMRAVRTP